MASRWLIFSRATAALLIPCFLLCLSGAGYAQDGDPADGELGDVIDATGNGEDAGADDGGDAEEDELLTDEERAARELAKRKNTPPALALSVNKLNAKAKQGESNSVRLKIRNAGGKNLNWIVSQTPAWITASPISGSLEFGQSADVVLVIKPGFEVPPGNIAKFITIEAPGAKDSPKNLLIQLEVAKGERASTGMGLFEVLQEKSRKRRTGFGLRAVYIIPDEAKDIPFDSSVSGELFVRMAKPQKHFAFEINSGFGFVDSSNRGVDGTDKSIDLIWLRTLYFYQFFDGTKSKWRPNVFLGIGGQQERFIHWQAALLTGLPNARTNTTSAVISFGGGLVASRERFELRTTYDLILDTNHVDSYLMTSLGWRF